MAAFVHLSRYLCCRRSTDSTCLCHCGSSLALSVAARVTIVAQLKKDHSPRGNLQAPRAIRVIDCDWLTALSNTPSRYIAIWAALHWRHTMADGRRSSTLGKQFVCKLCEASFPYPSKVKRHLRSRKHSLLESSNRARDDANSIAVDLALEDNVSCRCHFLQTFSCMHVSM